MDPEAEELLTSDAEETTPERMQLVVDIRDVGPCPPEVDPRADRPPRRGGFSLRIPTPSPEIKSGKVVRWA